MEYVMSCPVGSPVRNIRKILWEGICRCLRDCNRHINKNVCWHLTARDCYNIIMRMNKIDERLRAIMKKHDFQYPSQLAVYLQASEQTVRTWLKGTVPHSGSKVWDQLKNEEK